MPAGAFGTDRNDRRARSRHGGEAGVGWGFAAIGMLAGAACAFGGALLVGHFKPPMYCAHVDVMPALSSDSAPPVSAPGVNCVSTVAQRAAQALVQDHIVRGGELAEMAGEDAMRNLADELAGHIRIVPLDSARGIRVEAGGFETREQAMQAAELAVRAVTAALHERRLDEDRAETARLEQRSAALAERLAEVEKNLWRILSQADFVTLDAFYSQMAANAQEMRAIQAESRQVTVRLDAIAAELVALDGPLPDGESGDSVGRRRLELETLRAELRRDAHRLETRAATLQSLMEEAAARGPVLINQNRVYQRAQAERNHLRRELDQKEARIRDLAEAGGETVRRGPVCAVRVPRGPVVSYPLAALAGALAGALLALGWRTKVVSKAPTIRDAADLEVAVNSPVLGLIPRMRANAGRGVFRRGRTKEADACLITRQPPGSRVRDAYETLLDNLESVAPGGQTGSLLVTSAVPGEGKTTTAVNLAVTLAGRGRRVVLLDADLRRPGVHRLLGIHRGTGLSEVLREGLEPGSAVRPSRVENLWAMTAGAVPANPANLLRTNRMAEVLRDLTGQFDALVCDTPPLLVATDAALLASSVDACLLVSAARHARATTVRRAAGRLGHARRLAAVLNGARAIRSRYYYYYYYTKEGVGMRRRWRNFF